MDMLQNERRDREVKVKLYSRRNVKEYWVVNWQERTLEIYRREDAVLTLEKTLEETDVLQSPLLPGFSCKVSQLFTSLTVNLVYFRLGKVQCEAKSLTV